MATSTIFAIAVTVLIIAICASFITIKAHQFRNDSWNWHSTIKMVFAFTMFYAIAASAVAIVVTWLVWLGIKLWG